MGLPNGQPPSTKLVWLDQAYFLDLYARLLPDSYLDPLQHVGPGYEMLLAMAKVGERISLAVTRTEGGAFITTSFGGNNAAGAVFFARATNTYGAVTVKAGTVVTTTNGDRRFMTLADVVFSAMALGPLSAPVQALLQDWQHDVPGQRTTAAGQVLPGAVDTIYSALLDPPYGDPTIYAFNVADIFGGSPPMLDGLAADRGITRAAGESDTQLSVRARTLPDTVSPAAIRRAIASVFAPLGLTADLIETWDITYQTCYDAPAALAVNPDYNAALFVYDDPRPAYPAFCNRYLDEGDYRGAFIVVVPLLAAISDVGMAFDDTAETPAALETSLGARAINAYDVPSGFPFALNGGYDGFDLGGQAVYKSLYDVLEQIKAAGVGFSFVLQGQ